ncbi:hypothetical protein BDU57DRAFT_528737 [Ampelomyces quisqualis]|uniref:Uncharacterized protein n=1 Tax=Ampelomyces quisqualis TaxID=50730 RepID=A0A6A5QRD7_AMPQU|nr:hypothetical protein BDU57DRAFT_528737 [Ampelomyces quisqualis]
MKKFAVAGICDNAVDQEAGYEFAVRHVMSRLIAADEIVPSGLQFPESKEPVVTTFPYDDDHYGINILWHGVRKGYDIQVLVYRGLSDCRTPFNWHRRTSSTRYTVEELRSEYSPDHKPGSIRDQWNQASATVEVTDGAWRRII